MIPIFVSVSFSSPACLAASVDVIQPKTKLHLLILGAFEKDTQAFNELIQVNAMIPIKVKGIKEPLQEHVLGSGGPSGDMIRESEFKIGLVDCALLIGEGLECRLESLDFCQADWFSM